jgi:hypothetical protein
VYFPLPLARVLIAPAGLAACLAACLVQSVAASPAPQDRAPRTPAKPAGASSDLDAFMEKVLARREVNRKMLNQYVVDEIETFEVLGPGRWPMLRQKHAFTWFARDGMHVRSPVRFNGVTVGEDARREYERDWIRREHERQDQQAKRERERREKHEVRLGAADAQVGGGDAANSTRPPHDGTAQPDSLPRFVSESYFMDFKFEPGNYYLAGREKLEGQDVLRIEYYPTHLFDEKDNEKTPRETETKPSKSDRREQKMEQDIERKMNKTALVTLWVDLAEHQIVKYTFDNVWLDFLPGSWLVRVDNLRASMTMGQPFPGIWLPRGMNVGAGVTLANGSFEASYARTFSEYREGEVKTTIKVPKMSAVDGAPVGRPAAQAAPDGHGPFVNDQQAETIREVRVHGNASLADDDVIKLAGIAVGDPVPDPALKDIERRLKDSHRFETVEVRKRYRSLDDPTDVAIVLVVHERPRVSAVSAGMSPISRPWRRLTSRLMFLPILSYADGYGFSYGGRVSAVDLLGAGERLSVPLTWGGAKHAALELERTFARGPLTRVLSSLAIWNHRNPRFGVHDQRVEVKVRAERQFVRLYRTGLEATRSSVSFGQIDDRLWTLGANAALDTRGDPAFPGNAAVLGGGWSELHVRGLPKINRYNADARGYVRVVGQSVVAGRVQYFNTDAALPPYERLLLGGASTLRGFRAGAFDGDRMVLTSVEARVPITSVLSSVKLGVTVFADRAKVGDFGASLTNAAWHSGAGAGLFIIAPLVRVNIDVARDLDGGGTRVNIGSGFSF